MIKSIKTQYYKFRDRNKKKAKIYKEGDYEDSKADIELVDRTKELKVI